MNRLELLWGEAFFAGSIAQLLARLSGLPAVVLLLGVGLLIGRAGLDLVQPEALGRGLEPVVGLLVSLVLFDGGLNLRLAGRDLQRTVIQLVLVRGVLGLLGGALVAHALTPPRESSGTALGGGVLRWLDRPATRTPERVAGGGVAAWRGPVDRPGRA